MNSGSQKTSVSSSCEYVKKQAAAERPGTPCLALCRVPVCPQTPSICWFSYRHFLLNIEAAFMRGNNRKETFTDWALNAYRFLSTFLSAAFVFHVPSLLVLIISCHFSFPFVFCSTPVFLPFSHPFYLANVPPLCSVIPITVLSSSLVAVSLGWRN